MYICIHIYNLRSPSTRKRRLPVGLYTRFVRSKALFHHPIILILPPSSALLTLLQY